MTHRSADAAGAAGDVEVGVVTADQAGARGPMPVPVAVDPPGLRGTRLSTGMRCTAANRVALRQWRQEQRAIDDPTVRLPRDLPVVGTVDLIRVCPYYREDFPWRQRDLAAGSALLASAVTALGSPDGPAPTDELGLCSLEGDPTIHFVARTPSGTWLLHVPEDACGHPVGPVDRLYRQLLT